MTTWQGMYDELQVSKKPTASVARWIRVGRHHVFAQKIENPGAYLFYHSRPQGTIARSTFAQFQGDVMGLTCL